jgi:anthranilate phosphoribosyltransferase
MGIRDAIAKVVERADLSEAEAADAMTEIVEGQATAAQIGAFAVALRMKGETTDELTGLARVMRDAALRVETPGPVLDTAGTGGDGKGTFNISTMAALVAASAGVLVAKHHNRAISSRCGSADLLEALGVACDLPPKGAEECLRETGICFLFAPAYHPAMASAAAPRREIGVRTAFNILGPLTNPARAQHQLMGVPVEELQPKMAEVLAKMGTKHSLVIRGTDGMDEVTISGPTNVYEVRDGDVKTWTINPADYGYARAPRHAILGGDAAENAVIAGTILNGKMGAYRNVVELNAAAAMIAADRVKTMEEGIELTRKLIDDGSVRGKLEQVAEVTQRLKAAAAV